MGTEYYLSISFNHISGATADEIVDALMKLKTQFNIQDMMISFSEPLELEDEEFELKGVVPDAE